MNRDDARVEAFVRARTAGDEQALDALVASVPEEELAGFFAQLEAAIGPGEHDLDAERFHTALREAGFDAQDTLRFSQLAEGNMGTLLGESLVASERSLPDAAAEVVAQLGLEPATHGAVERYLRRLIEGRHDPRTVADRAMDAIAASFEVPARVLHALRDNAERADWLVPGGLAAARGNEGAGGQLTTGSVDHDDVVDELFCGRVPREGAE